MTKEQIFQYFYTNSANFGVKTIVIIMLAGLLTGGLIYVTYRITYRGVAYNSKFNVSLLVISLICVTIMLMISSNIVISLGMVGALSIVRYRTAVKDSRDTVFIFWSIAEGLCVGSQNFKLAIISTLFIAIILIIFSLVPNGRCKYMIVVTGENMDMAKLMSTMRSLASHIKVRSANSMKEHQEIIIEVRSRLEISMEYVQILYTCNGVKTVNWVAESGENLG